VKCPVCDFTNANEALACSQCGSNLTMHHALGRVKDFIMNQNERESGGSSSANPALANGVPKIIFSTAVGFLLLGIVLLSHFLLGAHQRLDSISKEIDLLRKENQTSAALRNRNDSPDIETLRSLANTLHLTTEILQQESKNRQDIQERERLANAKPARPVE
jgi:uncharacterized membrane protein YvbJ